MNPLRTLWQWVCRTRALEPTRIVSIAPSETIAFWTRVVEAEAMRPTYFGQQPRLTDPPVTLRITRSRTLNGFVEAGRGDLAGLEDARADAALRARRSP